MQLTALCPPTVAYFRENVRDAGQLKKLLLIMNFSAIFLLAICLQVAARGHTQSITISEKNASLPSIFKQIEKQSGYQFFYNERLLNGARKVSIQIKDAGLLDALNMCFKDQPFTYVIIDRSIVVKKADPVTPAYANAGLIPPSIDVQGRVVNEKGEPVEGVTVTVKGTRKATSTNADGEFTLTGINENATLVFTAINVETYEVAVNNRREISVSLKTKITAMGDVTVSASTGYQTISRERSTGAYNVISGDQLEKPSTNIAQRLIGTTSGLLGKLDVDGNPTFMLRGLTSLYANPQPQNLISQPLIVVDGFPIQGDFNSINPNDVESITVLKDAAASSIWGARSANGVIVVVTKKAKKGLPLKVEVSAFTRIGKKFDLDYVRPLASSAETVEYEKLTYANWRALQNPNSLQDNSFSFGLASTILNEANFGYITAVDRDARLEALKKLDNRQQIRDNLLANPVSTQYNINLYGSSGRMVNSLSMMYEKNQSNFQETNNNRYMVNYRTDANVFPWLDLNLSGMVLYNKAKNSGVNMNTNGGSDPLGTLQNMNPYEMLLNPDGSFTNISQYYWPIMQRLVPMSKFPYADWTYNPINEIHNRKLITEQLNTRIQAGLTFKILKGLSIDSKGQFELFNTFNSGFYNENTFRVRNAVNVATTWNQTANTFALNLPKGGILTQNRAKARSYNWRNQLNFNRTFGEKHEVNVIGGEEITNIVSETFGYPISYGYNDQTLTVGIFPNGPGGTPSNPGISTPAINLTSRNWLGSTQTFAYVNSFGYTTERYFSVFANASYTYNRKYTVSGSYRTDASNLIAEDPKYRYAPFWSVGLGWQVYREDFMKDISWVNRLNIRATYGYNGNVDRSTSFRPLIGLTNPPTNIYTGDFTATVTSFGNPTLRWEKTGTWNVGIDYAVFNGRLFGKIDVYRKYGKDLIAQLSIPAVNGTTSQKLNNAEMTNKGIELELGTYLKISRNISWSGNLNFSYNKNKITKLFVATYPASTLYSGGTGAYVVGENANSLWRFQYAGMVNGAPNVVGAKGATYDFLAFTPGDGRDYMLNTGTTVPPYVLGFVNSFQVKDFNFSFIVTGKFGHVFQRMGFNYPSLFGGRVLPNNKISEVLNGDPSKIVPLPQNPLEPRYYFWDRFHQYLSYLIENANHVRMQEINLTYAVPKNILNKFSSNRLLLYVQGNDLFTIYANNVGEDPEYPLGTMKPRPKITFGIKCEF